MNWVDILVIVLLVVILGGLAVYFFLRKKHGQGLNDCGCSSKGGKTLVKEYHKEKEKEEAKEEKGSCPHCHS